MVKVDGLTTDLDCASTIVVSHHEQIQCGHADVSDVQPKTRWSVESPRSRPRNLAVEPRCLQDIWQRVRPNEFRALREIQGHATAQDSRLPGSVLGRLTI